MSCHCANEIPLQVQIQIQIQKEEQIHIQMALFYFELQVQNTSQRLFFERKLNYSIYKNVQEYFKALHIIL